MIHPRHRTVAMVRLLRAAAPAMHRRRGGRMPRQQQPDGLRLEYFKAIRALVVAPAARAVAGVKSDILRLLGDVNDRRQDADEKSIAQALVERAAKHAAGEASDRELRAVAEKFGMRTSDFQKEQLSRQVRQAMGVPLSAIEKPTVDRIPLFTSSNVELIKTVPDRYFESVRAVTAQAFEEGWTVDRLSDEIELRGDVAESDARRIARDQIGKLNAQVNQDRQEALGVTGYVWRGVMDERERNSHRDLEGMRFDWNGDEPIGEDGDVIEPGQEIQCRCYAEPDLSGILAGLNSD